MDFRLVDTGWDQELESALGAANQSIHVVSPFIKTRAAQRLLGRRAPATTQIITRFNLDDFSKGVSDIAALRLLMESGARIRGIRHLHSKLYILGQRAIVTSANLTESALTRNHELGIVTDDPVVVTTCRSYFDKLWQAATADLTAETLASWESRIAKHHAGGGYAPLPSGLGDEGVDVGFPPDPDASSPFASEADQGFVKFFGHSTNRADRSLSVEQEVVRSGSQKACTYPRGKRPRQVRDGAIIYMGRLVRDPNDIVIYGRAIGIPHDPQTDDATADEVQLRPWKERWPHYVRVHDAEFLAGDLSGGVSLNEMMDALGADSFKSTQRNAANESGNVDPRKAYSQQPAVELTHEGMAWLNDRLERAYQRHGKMPPAVLDSIEEKARHEMMEYSA